MYTAQKSNSHYAPQPYTNQSVFKSLLYLQPVRDYSDLER